MQSVIEMSPSAEPDEYDKRNKAWKYAGYPAYARWMDSSNDFFVLRRFDVLNARVLLRLQHQIAQLEREIEELDKLSMHKPDSDATGRLDSLQVIEWRNPVVEDCLEKLTVKLERYNRYLSTYSALRERGTASHSTLNNVRNWMKNNPNAITLKEQYVLDRPSDAITIVETNQTVLRLALRQFLTTWNHHERTRYVNLRILDWMENTVIAGFSLSFVFAPVWVLQLLEIQQSFQRQLAVVMPFIGLFCLCVAASTQATVSQMILYTAAYAVVLLLFLIAQNAYPV